MPRVRTPSPQPRPPVAEDEGRRRRIRADLERRGVGAEFCEAICDRLAPFSQDLTPELYDAVLSGVAMAYGVQRRGLDAARETTRNLAEVDRLLGSFGTELHKLDEAIETLSAYLTRLRERAGAPDGKPLH